MSEKVHLILDTSSSYFTNWLEDYTSRLRIKGETIPTERGRLNLRRARQYRGGIGRFVWGQDAAYIKPHPSQPNTESVDLLEEVITIEIIPLSPSRIEIETSYLLPELRAYIDELLREIKTRWPQQENHGNFEEPITSSLQRAPENKRIRKGGRPSYPEDNWAWEQVHIQKRERAGIYPEWKEKAKHRKLIDPKRQFTRITNPEWGKSKEKEEFS